MAGMADKQGDGGSLSVAEEGFSNGKAGPPPGGMPALGAAFPLAVLEPATGTADRDLAVRLLLDVARGTGLGAAGAGAAPADDGDDDGGGASAGDRNAAWALAATLAAMRAIGPRDGLEGMLAAQMVAVHGAAMNFTGRALGPGQPMAARAVHMSQAARLMALFTRQMEVLERRRGAQPVSVGRVNVEAGGQAIVGTVHSERNKSPSTAGGGGVGEGVDDRRSRGQDSWNRNGRDEDLA